MKKNILEKNIGKIKIKILGSGSAEGIPEMGCKCKTCLHSYKYRGKEIRLRPSVIVQYKKKNILIDISPDIHTQLINSGCINIDLIILTHWHYDHFGGIAQFMYWKRHNRIRKSIPLLVSSYTKKAYERYISNLFPTKGSIAEKYRPLLDPIIVEKDQTFTYNEMELTFFNLKHGIPGNINCRISCMGKSISLVWDTGPDFSENTINIIKNTDIGIIEAAYPDSMPPSMKHLRFKEAIRIGEEMNWKKTYLMHISHLSEPHYILKDYIKKIGGQNNIVSTDGMVIKL